MAPFKTICPSPAAMRCHGSIPVPLPMLPRPLCMSVGQDGYSQVQRTGRQRFPEQSLHGCIPVHHHTPPMSSVQCPHPLDPLPMGRVESTSAADRREPGRQWLQCPASRVQRHGCNPVHHHTPPTKIELHGCSHLHHHSPLTETRYPRGAGWPPVCLKRPRSQSAIYIWIWRPS